MGFTTGSDASLNVNRYRNLEPWQQRLAEGSLEPYLSSDRGVYGGRFTSGLSGLEASSLAGLEDYSKIMASGGTPAMQHADQTLIDMMSGKMVEEQYGAIRDQAFEEFERDVMPLLHRTYAPEFFSGERREQEMRAGEDLEKYLTYAKADLTNQAADRALAAAVAAPEVSGANIKNLMATLSAGAIPRQVEDTELRGQYSEFLRLQDEEARRAQLIIQALGVNAGENIGVYNPAQPGAAQTFLGTAAGGQAVAELGKGIWDYGSEVDWGKLWEGLWA